MSIGHYLAASVPKQLPTEGVEMAEEMGGRGGEEEVRTNVQPAAPQRDRPGQSCPPGGGGVPE